MTKLTKAQAIKEVTSKGYVQYEIGMCGDGGYGSRIYFQLPGSPKNRFGFHLETATVSKVSGYGWMTSYFDK